MVAKRRKRRPNMHIYHYAPYEKTALLRLAGRYGVGEDEVDELLRSGTLVDLYPLVRKSIRVGAESFSLKALEPLYMGTQLRAGDVTTATDSITSYAKYCELRDAGRADEAATVLKEIEDYNHYDCRSTQELRNWLLVRAWESGVTPIGAQPVSGGERRRGPRRAGGEADGVHRRCRRRRPHAGADRGRAGGRGARLPPARGQTVLVGAFRPAELPGRRMGGQHRRLRRRQRVGRVDWHTPPRARKPQRRVQLARRAGPRRPDDGCVRALRAAGSAGHERQSRPAGGRAGRGCRGRRPGSAHRGSDRRTSRQ